MVYKCFLTNNLKIKTNDQPYSRLMVKIKDFGKKFVDFLKKSSWINLLKSTFGGLKHLSKRILLNKQKINQNIIVEIKDSRLRSMSSQRGLNEGWYVVNGKIDGLCVLGHGSEISVPRPVLYWRRQFESDYLTVMTAVRKNVLLSRAIYCYPVYMKQWGNQYLIFKNDSWQAVRNVIFNFRTVLSETIKLFTNISLFSADLIINWCTWSS